MATIAEQKKMNQHMNELQVKSDLHTRQMIMERKRLDDLDEALRQADEQIKLFRETTKRTTVDLLNQHRFAPKPAKIRTDCCEPSKLAETSRLKLISALEQRLNQMKIRLSQSEKHNETLKGSIDSLRRHRLTSNKSREAIEVSIRGTQRLIAGVLERARVVADERERLVERTAELHKVQQEDRHKFTEQMKSLAAYIEKQNRDFEDSIADAAKSTAANGSAAALAGNATAVSTSAELETLVMRGRLTIDEEREALSLVKDVGCHIREERDAMEHTSQRIALYKQSFDELKRVSGIDRLEDIVQKYVKSEEETFSLFNYVQAQNQETDWTQERNCRLEEEIKRYEEKLSEEEALRSESMSDLQGKWRSAKEATDECQHAAQEAQRTLERIAKKVQSLFFKIQCDQLTTGRRPSDAAAASKASGFGKSSAASSSSASASQSIMTMGRPDSRLALLSGQGVTDSNILAYAELIEQRALEIMSEYTRKLNHAEQHRMTPVLDPSRSLGNNPHDHLKPPEIELGDDENDDDDDGRPVALDEMRRRTAEKLTKKHNASRMIVAKRKDHHGSNLSKQQSNTRLLNKSL